MPSKKLKTIAIYLILFIFILILLFPVIWTFIISIKTPADAFSMPPKIIFKPTFRYYYELWIDRGFFGYLINSLIISISSVIISVMIASIASFALSHYKKKISGVLLISVLVLRMFPRFALLIPFFIMAKIFGLFDTRTIVVLVMVAINQPFAIWILRGFFEGVPTEVIDSSKIDGCSMFSTYTRIVLPIVIPGLITSGIFTFLLAYNEFLVPLVLTSIEAKTLPVAIAEYGAEDLKYWSLAAAGAISIAMPAVIILSFFQRYLVKGMTLGAIKE